MNNFSYYTLAFAFVLGVLIVAHELGHFIVARWVGVKVLRFSVGFGRPLWSRRFGADGTEWAIGIFPLGGYVKMLDEREGQVAPDELHRSFNRQSVWHRMAIVVAGPLANLLLAIALYWGVFLHGTEELKPILGTPVAASPAAAAGIQNGERILKVGGEPVATWQEFRWVLLGQASERASIDLEVINTKSEVSIRRLDLARIRDGGLDAEAFEKLGIRFFQPRIPAVIGKLVPNSPADLAGFKIGDEIISIGRNSVTTWQDVVQEVRASPVVRLDMLVVRQGREVEIAVTPELVEEGGRQFGRIGAGVVAERSSARSELTVTVRYGVFDALGKAVDETWEKTRFTLVMIGKMISGAASWKNISGPVTIADYAGQTAKLGFDHYLKFMALISVSLAVLNLLPIPILDGGHLMYYVAELVMRRPLSERSIEIGQKIGLVLMLMLMACSFYNDLNRLISG